jgi:dUTP pyrophosphatase
MTEPKRLVYIAYPIDNAMLSQEQVALIERSKEELLSHDTLPVAVVFDPGDAFMVRKGSTPGRELSEINGHAIDTADGVLAWLPMGVPSIGVPMEIARAGMVGTPVAVISDSYSWALHVDRDNVKVFREADWRAAVEWLASVEWFPGEFDTRIEPMPYVGDPWHGPTRAYADDAGLDLRVSEETTLYWGTFKDVPLGINVALPEWSWGFLVGRSSTFRKRNIEIMPGIIDTGYRGQLFAACIWRPDDVDPKDRDRAAYVLEAGDRIAQMIIIPNGTRDVMPVQMTELPKHERGINGFGSSGS